VKVRVLRSTENQVSDWSFYMDDSSFTLYLDTFTVSTRESRRHRFKPVTHYHRLLSRDSNIAEDAVPLPDDVKAEAIASVTDQLCVKKWSERERK
jgi:hypothetical protein